MKEYKKILVVNVNWVGDVIFSTPVFKALKKAYPKAHLACLAVPRVREILECAPCVDEIIVYDEKGKDFSPLAKLRLILSLRQKNFDIAFLLHRSLTRALLVFLAGIPERVGYDTKGRGLFLTKRIPLPEEEMHRLDFYLKVIESFGIAAHDRSCELKVDDEAKRQIAQILWSHNVSPEEPLLVINAGGNWDLKRWPKERFSAILKLATEHLHTKVVIPGSPKDLSLAEEIARLSGVKPIILAGQTSLKQLIALMARANLVVSADTGPLHMANSVNTPVIGIFGPTRPEVTGPRGKGKSVVLLKEIHCNPVPCYNLGCPNNECMQSVTVEEVFENIEKIILKVRK